MTSFFRRVKAAWLFSQVHPHVDDFKPDFWEEQDAKDLSRFLTGRTGRKWRLYMLKHIQDAAFRATLERNYAAYECGCAFGCRGLMAVSDSLLQIPASQSESDTEQEPDEALDAMLDRLAP